MPAPESDQEIVTDPEGTDPPLCQMRKHEHARVCVCLHACCAHDIKGVCRACDCETFDEAPVTEAPAPPPPPPCSKCRYGRVRADCPICRGTGVMGGAT